MRALWNNLSDPSLHLLAIAMILAYLGFGTSSRSDDVMATSPLAFCARCHVHYLPGKACGCHLPPKIANALP